MNPGPLSFSYMQSLNLILKKFVKDFGLAGGAVFSAVCRRWPEIVGEGIAAHTYPDIVKGKILTLIVDSPQWMHHLGFYKEEIINKLDAYGVKDVRFRLGKLPAKAVETTDELPVELSDDDLRYIENTVRGLDDDEMKKAFKKLIAHGLMRGKERSP